MTLSSAISIYNNDARFHMICLSAVHEAMDRARDWMGEIELRDVHDIALDAAIIALKRAFDENAELSAIRMERDHYKAMALQFAALTPPAPILIVKGETA